MNLQGKKLLIIGGAFQHCKLVEVAHELGIIVYVVDYLPVEQAPAKQIADYHYEYNITDYDDIINLCKTERIDGAISTNLDACQKPYQEICERMNYPCFGNKRQYQIYTDKNEFKKWCIQNGLKTIPQYDIDFFSSKEKCYSAGVQFPVLVKPAISRGSRGQTICYQFEEIANAVAFARSESSNEKVVIEKYMGNKFDFSVAPLTLNGTVYIERTSDRYLGNGKMDKSAILCLQPSSFSDKFETKIKPKLVQMIKNLGIQFAPMMMQGFFIDDDIYFYDPGLRFGGFEYERFYEIINGIDPRMFLIEYALTGKVENSNELEILKSGYLMCGKKVCVFYVPILPGKINKIQGISEIKKNQKVINFNQNYFEGDIVGEHYNVKQRFCEINMICDNIDDVKAVINWINRTLIIEDEKGNDMKFSLLDTSEIRE